ncbi:choline O-acetyltransferase [Anabrus simplex]|uniref:choline O-acetyltransferase n=1 Tax=Anabrus simplex TaxID=316456 RepID=UPI0035A272BE
MYLNNPAPLPVNSNPGMVFPPRRFSSREDAARFAARFIVGVVAHKCIVDRMALPVERATSREKGQPLCMAQYYRLLSAHRQPGRSNDQLIVREQRQHQDEHIVVMCANQMYALPVKSSDRGPVSEADLYAQLLHILGEVPSLPQAPPVGLLTSERRDVWARVKDSLSADAQNRLNLDILQGALLVLCLDTPLPTNFNCRALRSETHGHVVGDRDETNMAHQMLHGGGSTANGANRWYDKTVQIVVSSDGVCGLCYEHSPSEGVAVIQLVEDVLKKCESNLPPVQPTNHSTLTSPHRMQWVLDQNAFHSMEEAARNLDSSVEDLDFYVYRFMGYGKEFIKKCQVSPDVYIQLALQLAYYRLNRRLVATYESASTRRYLLGRVDCIRSATCEALEWVTTMCQDASGATSGAESDDDLLQTGKKVSFSLFDQQKKLDLFDMAVKKQTDVMIQNILGQGIDIHLLGLREMAKELEEPIPELFQDEVYRIANHFALSTSQVPTSLDSFMGYGPVVPDGYGASYNPKKDSIVFCLSAFNSCESTSTWKFAQSLETSLYMMQELLSKRPNNPA